MYEKAIVEYDPKSHYIFIDIGHKYSNIIGYSLMNLDRYDEADISFTKPIEMHGFK